MFTSRVWLSVILATGVAVLCMGMVRGETSISSYLELKRSRDVLRSAVENLEAQNTEIELEISKIKKSSSYAEKILRDKYHVVEEGESIVFFAN
jgi:cell division protein FtsB